MYNFKDFDAQFPDDAACLDFIFRARFANLVCECGKAGGFHRLAKRRKYCCAWCGHQIAPTAGTIFHKSETSLKSWFFAIFLFAKSKNGVAATHHSVSPKYLQGYINEFAWRYSHRFAGEEPFASLVAKTGLTPATATGETSI